MSVIEKPQAQEGPLPPIPPSVEPPPRELSPLRVAILIAVLLAAGLGAWRLIADETTATAKSDANPVYAPYVDVTQTPTYPFQLPSANPVSSVYLGFIVSDRTDPCRPSWGDYYTLPQAEQALDLDARTTQLRNQGGSAMVSFGGRDNSELAVGCRSAARLVAAYTAPIERYGAAAIDLDLEGETLADSSANARRATAIATVQRRMAARHKPLRVWLTLPVSSQGLTAEGLAAVRSMLSAHVALAGVNAMAMDFGPGEGAEDDMVGTVERALDATHEQVQSLWRAAGLKSGAAAAWGSLGVTVMLGVSDIPGQRFTTADAHKIAAFASRRGIPRVSAWSLNRDSECGGAFPRVGVVSSTCSGVRQSPLEFTRIFSHLSGTKTARRRGPATSAATRSSAAPRTDDPAKSPYPIWRPTAPYVTGFKVVWQGRIYQANWWNQATPPGVAPGSPNDPWQQIGPVPPGSHAPKPVLLASGGYTAWSSSAVYHQGQRVSFNGLPYEARWYTHGEQPIAELPDEPGSPWKPLFTYPGEPRGAAGEGGPSR